MYISPRKFQEQTIMVGDTVKTQKNFYKKEK